MVNSIRVPISPRKASIYKGLLGLGSTNMPAILYYISGTDIVTKYTRVNKWKPFTVLLYREKIIRYLVAFLVKMWYNVINKTNIFLFAKSTLNDSDLRAVPKTINQTVLCSSKTYGVIRQSISIDYADQDSLKNYKERYYALFL